MKLSYKSDLVTLVNGDCFEVMESMKKKEVKVSIVLTSPPYNSGRADGSKRAFDNYEARYDIYLDAKTQEEYLNWTVDLFNHYDSILEKDGVILYNVSFGNEDPNTMWLLPATIINNTNFMIADCIIWKKGHAIPNNVSHNKLTRITEFVFVICRKDEFKTFKANKKVKSVSKTGQKYYENLFNFIEARNTSWRCQYNKAIFSLDLVDNLLKIYYTGGVVYDSFSGSGTTLVACQKRGIKSIGSELSKNQCLFTKELLQKENIYAKTKE